MKHKVINCLISVVFFGLTGACISNVTGMDIITKISTIGVDKQAITKDFKKIPKKESNKEIENTSKNKKEQIDVVNQIKNLYLSSKLVNVDVVGWIYIPYTNINYPILKRSNSFYLRHDINRNYSLSGSIFLDEGVTNIESMSLIHGHNMDDGSMFHDLLKFKDSDFLNNRSIFIYNGVNVQNYKAVDVLSVDPKMEVKVNFNTYKEQIDYLVKIGVEREKINESAVYSLLNTCSNNDSTHIILVLELDESIGSE